MENELRDSNGRFAEGHSGSKPVGAVHEKTRRWNLIGEWFTTEGIESYQNNLFNMLESNDSDTKVEAMKRFEALLEYFKPKLSRSTGSLDVKGNIPITINKKYNSERGD